MTKITFKQDSQETAWGCSNVEISFDFNGEYDEIVYKFNRFLGAIGYSEEVYTRKYIESVRKACEDSR